MRRIDAESRLSSQSAAQAGTEIHDALEAGFAGRPLAPEHRPHWQAVQRMLSDNFHDVTDWVSEKSFAHPAGFGGKSDLFSPSTGIVIDFKSTQISEGEDKRLHYDQFEQLAAYQWGLNLPQAPCANIFLSRNEPGYAVFHGWGIDEIAEGLETFQDCLHIWQRRKKYKP